MFVTDFYAFWGRTVYKPMVKCHSSKVLLVLLPYTTCECTSKARGTMERKEFIFFAQHAV